MTDNPSNRVEHHGPDDCTYRCPNTGREVLAFRDERHVVVPSDEHRALLDVARAAERVEVHRLGVYAPGANSNPVCQHSNWALRARLRRHLEAIFATPCRCWKMSWWRLCCLRNARRYGWGDPCPRHAGRCAACIAEHALYIKGDHPSVR